MYRNMKSLVPLLLVQAVVHAAANGWELHRLGAEEYPMATCLDGSQGVYYVRKGKQSEKTLVYMEGGGWCDFTVPLDHHNQCFGMAQNCISRSQDRLGSTLNDTVTANFDAHKAYLNTDPAINPAFHDWTAVFIRYCDGASFSGRRVDQMEGGLYSRGNYILEAVMEDLQKDDAPLVEATHVVLTGASAGGLATYLHANQWRKALPSTVDLVAMPDAGFFPEYNRIGNKACPESYAAMIKSVFEMSNATGSLDAECLQQFESKEQYKCMFAAYAAPHVMMPMLILQSKFDAYQLHAILGFHYDHPNNTFPEDEVIAYSYELSNSVLKAFDAQGGLNVESGLFLDECVEHSVQGMCAKSKESFWTSTIAGDIRVNQAVKVWIDRVFGGEETEDPFWTSYTQGDCGACGPGTLFRTCR